MVWSLKYCVVWYLSLLSVESPIITAEPTQKFSFLEDTERTIEVSIEKQVHPQPTASNISWTRPSAVATDAGMQTLTPSQASFKAQLTLPQKARQLSGNYEVQVKTKGGMAKQTVTVIVLCKLKYCVNYSFCLL